MLFRSGSGRWGEVASVRVSVATDVGIDALLAVLETELGAAPAGEGEFSARRRHLDALARAGEALEAAEQCLAGGQGELAAEELRVAHRALAEITGGITSEELLGRIFESFCIGK